MPTLKALIAACCVSLPLIAAAAVETRGTLVLDGFAAPQAAATDALQRYQNTRSAALQGFMVDGGVLITTRFGETAQLHRVKAPGSARSQLSFYAEPIAYALPHPKKPGALFAKDIGGNEFFQLYWMDTLSGEITLLTDGKSRNTGALWNHDGSQLAYSSTQRNGKDVDILVRDMATGQVKTVLQAGGEWQALDFAPDQQTLLVRKGISINEAELHLLNISSGTLTRFHPTQRPAYFGQAKFDAKGTGIIFSSDEIGEFRSLYWQAIDQKNPAKALTADIAWNVEDIELSPNGKLMAFVSNEDGISKLHLRPSMGGKDLPVPALPMGLIGGIEFSPSGKTLGLSLERSTGPSDVYSFAVGRKTLSQWTESETGGLATQSFSAPTLIRYPSFDGLQIPAFVYKPAAKAGRKAPVLINIHGGPEAQALPNFSPTFQYYLQELGIAVITPNVRGSDGYGKKYLQLDNGMRREDSVKDIGALLDWIAQQSDLDASRVVVMGGSYGGYMTLACMTHYNDRLKAGIDIVGISHFKTFLQNTQDYRRDLRRVEYGDERIPEIADFMERIAPLNNAGKITKPMFIIQGANDPRVPESEAAQMVAKIRANGGNVWYLLAKDEGHGFRKKGNRDFQAAATVEFLQQTLLGP